MIARIIFLAIIIAMNSLKTVIRDSVIEKNRNLLLIIMILIFGVYYIILNDIGHMSIQIDNMYIMLIVLTILFVFICILFVKMSHLYDEKTKYMLKNKELEYLENNKSVVRYLHDNTLKIQHSLRYGLLLIEHEVNALEYDEAKKQIKHFYNLLDDKTNIMTDNYIFDTLFNDYIFYIRSNFNTKVKTLINIDNMVFFSNSNLCTKTIDIISNFFEQSDKTYIDITIIEYKNYVEIDLLSRKRVNDFKEDIIKKIEKNIRKDIIGDYVRLKVLLDKEDADVLNVYSK